MTFRWLLSLILLFVAIRLPVELEDIRTSHGVVTVVTTRTSSAAANQLV